jgi:hypothetical protein
MGNRDIEGPIHRSILAYLRLRFPKALIHHSANEMGLQGDAVARQIAKAKTNGMVPGFPDIMVIAGGGLTMFFEVKAPGGRLTPAQQAVHDHLRALGQLVAVVRSIDEVQAQLDQWRVAG